jgi:tetratricopeptide (TPR) repeat protein
MQPTSATVALAGAIDVYARSEQTDEACKLVDRWREAVPRERWTNEDARLALWRTQQCAARAEPELAITLTREIVETGLLNRMLQINYDAATLADVLYRPVSAWFYGSEDVRIYERILEEVLSVDPSHPGANNDLGYSWADRGVRLEEAERFIEIAFAKEPKNTAYLDSLGWVRYKRGQLEDTRDDPVEPGEFGAITLLIEASNDRAGRTDPVILDHLGDALWRAERHDEAVKAWQRAVQAVELKVREIEAENQVATEVARQFVEDEYGEVRRSAQAKIESSTGDQEPAIAAIGGSDQDQ